MTSYDLKDNTLTHQNNLHKGGRGGCRSSCLKCSCISSVRRNRRNPIKNALCINGETFSNVSRLATAGRDALHCHPVSVATGRHGNWGGGELVAGEEGGGEDGKGTGTNRPRLATSDQAIVESLSARKVLYFPPSSYLFIGSCGSGLEYLFM